MRTAVECPPSTGTATDGSGRCAHSSGSGGRCGCTVRRARRLLAAARGASLTSEPRPCRYGRLRAANGFANETLRDGGDGMGCGGQAPPPIPWPTRRTETPETRETRVVVLITQRSRVQIPPPLPGKTVPAASLPGPFSAICDQSLGHIPARYLLVALPAVAQVSIGLPFVLDCRDRHAETSASEFDRSARAVAGAPSERPRSLHTCSRTVRRSCTAGCSYQPFRAFDA